MGGGSYMRTKSLIGAASLHKNDEILGVGGKYAPQNKMKYFSVTKFQIVLNPQCKIKFVHCERVYI